MCVWTYFLNYFKCICVNTCMYICALCTCLVPREAEECVESTDVGITDSCELPDMETRNPTHPAQ